MARAPSSKKPLPRPHKRPRQARAQFTVQVLYEAFVRIWRRGGAASATMRAIADEAGYAVGTLYEYFPNREAVLSGYFRHCLDDLCQRLHAADSDGSLAWQQRLRRLVSVTLGEVDEGPYFDSEMLLLESQIADRGQHEKAFRLLCDTWRERLSQWPDLPAHQDDVIPTLVTHLWGARRYALLLGRPRANAREVEGAAAMSEVFLQG